VTFKQAAGAGYRWGGGLELYYPRLL